MIQATAKIGDIDDGEVQKDSVCEKNVDAELLQKMQQLEVTGELLHFLQQLENL